MERLARIDWLSVFVAVASSLIGVVVLYGGGVTGEDLAIKKFIWLLIGVGAMFLFANINYQLLGSFAPIIYAAGILLLLLVLIPFLGKEVKGARSWFSFAGISFQPAELMKLALVIALSKYLVLRESEIGKLKELIIPALLAALPAFLVGVQPDLGGAVMFLAILFGMLFIGGANTAVLFGFAIIGFFALFTPMYLEYERYVIVDDIYTRLRETHFRLADAVRILNFEVWEVAENLNYNTRMVADRNLAIWAKETLATGENLKIFWQTAAAVEAENPSLLRDMLRNTAVMLSVGATGILFYGLGILGHFMTGAQWMRRVANLMLIIGLSFTAGWMSNKFINFKPHQVVRIVSFVNPDKFQKGAGYQLRHSLITVGSGKFAGKGLFQGDMTKGETPFLPEWYNDFIFSVVGEQLGFWGVSLLLLLLFGLILRAVQVAMTSKDDFGAMLASGIGLIFFLHVAINIGIALGLLPVTGIPLSFVSYGGSHMLLCFISTGILINIHRRRFINA
ncbi:MAG: FtsW/RodA/SpoVE family cell cycle protein [Leptospiraceae bacterium]|nr:FtsW/RodA/SpoVE family cell cycle protein [Leptospiraceae bacterium]